MVVDGVLHRQRMALSALMALKAGDVLELPPGAPLTVLGAASNLIIRDGGLAGVVVRLGGGFGAVATEADGAVAGAAPGRARGALRGAGGHGPHR